MKDYPTKKKIEEHDWFGESVMFSKIKKKAWTVCGLGAPTYCDGKKCKKFVAKKTKTKTETTFCECAHCEGHDETIELPRAVSTSWCENCGHQKECEKHGHS